MFVLSIVEDEGWTQPTELDDDGWRNLAANVKAIEAIAAGDGLTVALHPHVGTLVETDEQVRLALERLDVGWCLDTGHLLIGGVDPVAFVRDHGDRIVHAHLKDVDTTIAARVRSANCRSRRRQSWDCLCRSDAAMPGSPPRWTSLLVTDTTAGSCSSRTRRSARTRPAGDASRSPTSGRASRFWTVAADRCPRRISSC